MFSCSSPKYPETWAREWRDAHRRTRRPSSSDRREQRAKLTADCLMPQKFKCVSLAPLVMASFVEHLVEQGQEPNGGWKMVRRRLVLLLLASVS